MGTHAPDVQERHMRDMSRSQDIAPSVASIRSTSAFTVPLTGQHFHQTHANIWATPTHERSGKPKPNTRRWEPDEVYNHVDVALIMAAT